MAPRKAADRRVKNGRVRKAKYAKDIPKRKSGFDVFEVKKVLGVAGKKSKKVIEVVSPETGIHSKQWAVSIVSQECKLFALPIEVRENIWTYAILGHSRPLDRALCPTMKGNKFSHLSGNQEYSEKGKHYRYPKRVTRVPSFIEQYNSLSTLCKQSYVDIVGGGLLYALVTFTFTSPGSMSNYLKRINPFHMTCIRSVILPTPVSAKSTIAKLTTEFLASMTSLQVLRVEANMSYCLKWWPAKHIQCEEVNATV